MNDTTVLDDAPVPEAGAPRRQYIDPFGDRGSIKIAWSSELNVGQLFDEFRALEGITPDAQYTTYTPEDDEGNAIPADADHPYVFFFTPPTLDVSVLKKALAAHRPDPYYGMDADQREQLQLVAKLRSGEDLTLEEMQKAIRMAVGIG
ncbi:hypothetical protein ACFZAM_31175 [Streptomyces sp. NPDC008079]|uniref:hypothetical protein n=1 Tax=Streptomyces sp. NPDC008079 TaxID=3364806 RepID=UPI0036E3B7FD